MKRTVTLLAALILLVSAPVSAASPFSDVRQTDWFASYVETAQSKGIVSGYPDGSFRPSRQVSYGEFLAMAMRGSAQAAEAGAHWARRFYDAAVNAEVFDASQIAPRFLDEPIPRKDMALVMAGLLSNAGLGGKNVRQADRIFSDVRSSDEREYPIALCAYYGVLSGYPDGSFRPLGFLTRAEAAAAMVALNGVAGFAAPGVPAVPENPDPSEEAAKDPSSEKEPATREELLARESEHSLLRTGDPKTLELMDPAAKEYLQAVIASARFLAEDGTYRVRLSWPAMPEGFGGKLDVQVCDEKGTGLDGKVWVLRKGMEKVPTYTAALQQAGGTEYVFDIASLNGAGSVSLLVSLTREDGLSESSLALAQQNLKTCETEVQYKLASAKYQLSCTMPLADGIFTWK